MKDYFNLKKIDSDFKKIDRDFEKVFGSNAKSHTFGKVKEPRGKKYKNKKPEKLISRSDIENAKKVYGEINNTLTSIRKLINKYRGEKMPNLNKMTQDEIIALGERVKDIECKREQVQEAREIIIAYYKAQKEEAKRRRAERWNKVKRIFGVKTEEPIEEIKEKVCLCDCHNIGNNTMCGTCYFSKCGKIKAGETV